MRTRARTLTLVALGCASLSASFFGGASHADVPAPVAIPAKQFKKTPVCTDGKQHFIAMQPDERSTYALWYGDGKTLSQVSRSESFGVPYSSFLDPRFPIPTNNPDFRGVDWRNYSSIEFDEDKNTCAVSCGTTKTTLTVVPTPDAQKYLASVAFKPSPKEHEPYVLARDDHGTYYLVDRGTTATTKDTFRVFVGKKGAMKQQKMKDVAADSEGEVFSTASGDLRFITDRDESTPKKTYTWVHNGASVGLKALPIQPNLSMIYNQLGVYTGDKLGTPCDIF